MLIAESVEIHRPEPGKLMLQWQTSPPRQPVQVALEQAPEEVLATVTEGVYSTTLADDDLQPVFRLQDAEGHVARIAERHLPLAGTPNFRDFGGYWTEDGRQVRWGQLYRSGQLATLRDADVVRLEGLGLELVCDFRRDEERQHEPSRLPDATPIIGLSIAPGSTGGFYEALLSGELEVERTAEFMLDINRELALEQREPYRRLFEQLLEARGPLLVHCAVGKDRTGFAVALILACLGVPRDRILADYLLTTEYLCPDREVQRIQEKYAFTGDLSGLRPMLEAREMYLAAAFDAIDASYESMNHYLEAHLGLPSEARQRLRERLLYPLD